VAVNRVFVDTNVLFPVSVMDLMLALTEDSIHEVIWTDRLLAEWERVIVRHHRRSTDSARAVDRECPTAVRWSTPPENVGRCGYRPPDPGH
jgi:hypothetical protein